MKDNTEMKTQFKSDEGRFESISRASLPRPQMEIIMAERFPGKEKGETAKGRLNLDPKIAAELREATPAFGDERLVDDIIIGKMRQVHPKKAIFVRTHNDSRFLDLSYAGVEQLCGMEGYASIEDDTLVITDKVARTGYFGTKYSEILLELLWEKAPMWDRTKYVQFDWDAFRDSYEGKYHAVTGKRAEES